IESFGRTQMMHHGIPSYGLYTLAKPNEGKFRDQGAELEKEFRRRVKNLEQFLRTLIVPDKEELSANPFFDSYVVLTVDEPRLRTPTQPEPETFRAVKRHLVAPLRDPQLGAHSHICIHRLEWRGHGGVFADGKRRPAVPDPSEGMRPHWRCPIHLSSPS